jgi:hypothetical protein
LLRGKQRGGQGALFEQKDGISRGIIWEKLDHDEKTPRIDDLLLPTAGFGAG